MQEFQLSPVLFFVCPAFFPPIIDALRSILSDDQSQNKKWLSVWVWLDKAFPKKDTDNRCFN
jgi:hypothetical protein